MRQLLTLLSANVATTLQTFLVGYIASSYLEQFLPPAQIGLVFGVTAGIIILGFAFVPFVLERMSVRHLALVLSAVDIASLGILATKPSPVIAVGLIALQGAVTAFLSYTLDLFLEKATPSEGRTGWVRGLFLSAANIAIVAGSLLLGVILDSTNDYERVFSWSTVIMIVFVGIMVVRKRQVHDIRPTSHISSFFSTLRCLLFSHEMRANLIANTILQCFFIWAPLYIPLYLHTALGMSWSTLGPIFAFMLLPFLLIELPMGLLEDRFVGKQRFIMSLGFLIMGASFVSISFIDTTTSLALITIILILTRVGAALIEITAETTFFRSVSVTDTESIGIFRATRPLGALIGAVVGSALLLLLPLQELFIPLGLVVIYGVSFAARI